jgi:AraC-like DNA-binding protein
MKIFRYTTWILTLILSLSLRSYAQYDKYIKLENLYNVSEKTDSLKLTLQNHYTRALLEKDSLEQLKVLNWIYWYSDDNEQDSALRDSLLSLASLIGSSKEASRLYYTFASKEFEKGDLSNSTHYLEKSIQIALSYFDYEQALESFMAFNSLLMLSNQSEKAISNLNYLNWSISKAKKVEMEKIEDLKRKILIEKTSLFLNSGLLDSSTYYSQTLSKDFHKLDRHNLGKFKLIEATLNYRNQYFLNARDSLQKYLSNLDKTQVKDAWYVLSLLEKKLGNDDYSDDYLRRIDSALKLEGYPLYNNGIPTYRRLLSIAPDSLKNKYLGLFYHYENGTNRNFDSFTKASQINESIKFSTPILIIFSAVIFFLLISWALNISSKRKKQLYSSKVVDETNFSFGKKLLEWENQKEFLNPSTTLASLATILETNTSYLSKYFNQELKISFSNYLSNLRINHLLHLLNSNPSIVKSKSSIQIAESLGFKSIDAYARAFKVTTGCTPNQYLKKVITVE